MVRIKFKIEHSSPFLQVCAGTIHVEEVDSVHISNAPIELFRCKFKKERNTLGYSSIHDGEGIPSALFNCLKPILNTKIRSYWYGMILENEDYEWVPTDGDESWTCFSQLQQEVEDYIERRKQGVDEKDVIVEEMDSRSPNTIRMRGNKGKV